MFAKEILNYDIETYIPCALIIGAPHYHHLDFRTISPKRSNWTEFLARGDAMLEYFHSLYPAWNTFLFTKINETIPNHPNTILKHVKELPKDCPFNIKTDYKQTHQVDIHHATHHHFHEDHEVHENKHHSPSSSSSSSQEGESGGIIDNNENHRHR